MYLVELQQLIAWLSTFFFFFSFKYLLVLAHFPRFKVQIFLFQILKMLIFSGVFTLL